MTSQAANQIVASVARNIRCARLAAGMTQREVAVELNTDSRGISRWENGKVTPSPTRLAQLAQLFGHDPGWFYTDHQSTDDEPVAA